MINPEGKLLSLWHFLIIISSIFSALLIPVVIFFEIEQSFLFNVLQWVITGIFFVDIFINFNTSFSIFGKVINNRKSIAGKYLRGSFTIDFLAALPLGSIIALSGITFISPLFGGLFYLNRLLKLLRINKIVKRIAFKINPAILRLFLLVFWILLAAHFISCAWAYIYNNPDNLSPTDQYIQSFYWTITTLTTIGYGDISPNTSSQTIFVIVIEILGAGMYGLIIGNIANLIANIDVAKTQYKERMEKINTFLNYRNIPGKLKKKINNYYSYLWDSRRGYNESSVLEDLPDPLKVSVALYLNKEIIEKVPIFEGASDEFIKEIIMNLTPVVYTPGDPIVLTGEVGFDMFFISRGAVDVLSADEKTLYNTLHAGQFFGEIALLLSMPRTATIRAKEYCDLYRLDKHTFENVLSRYPDFAASIRKLASERKAEIEAITVEQQKTHIKEDEEQIQRPSDDEHQGVEYKVPDKINKVTHLVNDSGIVLNWEKVKDFRHYEIIKREQDDDKWRFLSKLITDSEYCDNSLLEGVNSYRIRAVNISGPGPWSSAYKVII